MDGWQSGSNVLNKLLPQNWRHQVAAGMFLMHFLFFSLAQFFNIDVSENRDTPKSSIFNRVFHYKPSILGAHPYFSETPICSKGKKASAWGRKKNVDETNPSTYLKYWTDGWFRNPASDHQLTCILPRKLTCPLKINGWKMNFLLK